MEKIFFIISIIIGLIGLYKIDYVLYEGLNYFGKYVFFGLFNIFVLYIFWFFYKKFRGVLQITLPLLWGVLLFILGFKFM